MKSQYIFLSFPLSEDTPTPPAIPDLELSPFLSLEKGDEANVTSIKMVSHIGTHVDAPKHVIEDGLSLTDFEPREFIFHKPKVINLKLEDGVVVMPDHLAPHVAKNAIADLLIFRFGYNKVRSIDPVRYSTDCPGFGIESAAYLRENFPKMRALGMDVPSLSCIKYLDQTMAAHNVLLEGADRRFLIVEDMNLEQDLTRLSSVILAPLLIQGGDGNPCTIFGKLD